MTVKTDEKEILRQKDFAEKVKNIIGEGKKYLLITLGCQQNESDSEKLHGMLGKMGYTETESLDDADLILYNTCAASDPLAKKALEGISELKGAEAHSTVILSQVDENMFKKLGINLTCEATYNK